MTFTALDQVFVTFMLGKNIRRPGFTCGNPPASAVTPGAEFKQVDRGSGWASLSGWGIPDGACTTSEQTAGRTSTTSPGPLTPANSSARETLLLHMPALPGTKAKRWQEIFENAL